MWKDIKCFFIIVFLAIISYANVINNDFVNYDDPTYIIDNQRIKSDKIMNAFALFNPAPFLKGSLPKKLNEYLPVRDLTLWLDYQLWKLNPQGYHLTNLIIYILLCVAIFILLKKLVKNQLIALFTVILYTVHPLHTENVAWVSARKDLLSALFYILSLIAYINFSRTDERKFRRIWYSLSFLYFLAGWFSKPLIITLPAIFVICGILEKKKIREIFLETLIFWGFDIMFLLVNTIIVQGVKPLLKGPSPGLFCGINYIGYYFYLFFLPHHLTPIREPLSPFTLFHFILSILLIVFLLILIIRQKNLLFPISFFFLNILPVLNLTVFANYSIHDRYMLIPSAGLSLLVTEAFFKIKNLNLRNSIFVLCVSAILLLTLRQNTIWKDSETLWKNTLKVYPESSIAHLNLGSAYLDNKEHEKAELEFFSVINLPEPIPEMRSSAYYNLGIMKLKSGMLRESLNLLESALNDFPEPARIYRIMAGIYVKLREPGKAIKHYEMSLTLDPNQPERELIKTIIMRLKSIPPPLPEGKP